MNPTRILSPPRGHVNRILAFFLCVANIGFGALAAAYAGQALADRLYVLAAVLVLTAAVLGVPAVLGLIALLPAEPLPPQSVPRCCECDEPLAKSYFREYDGLICPACVRERARGNDLPRRARKAGL